MTANEALNVRPSGPGMATLLVADFTIAGLSPFLSGGEAPALRSIIAPFDQVVPVLLDGEAECWRSQPQIAVVWTRPDAAVKTFGRVLNHEHVPLDDLLQDVDRFTDAICVAAPRVAALFVPTWTWPSHDRNLGVLALDPAIGPAYALMRMNLRLIENLASDSTIHVLDAARWMARVGANASSPKLWHLGKIAFGPEVFKHAAADIKAGIRAVRGSIRKLVVLDLDDTLWGGIVGDIGWEQVALGGHNPIGEGFSAFQRALKRLTHRGILLAIVSKNTEAVALDAIDRHPEMVLRRNDFAGWRINWEDKVQNLLDLVTELRLGLDSVVFIDDNPAERSRVREALPDVLVPDWPADKLLYERALTELTCFDAVTVSEEDRGRTRTYVAERARAASRQSAQSMDEYLASLGLKVEAEPLTTANVVRAAQLLNKTNQMNLATRRLTEAQYLQWADATAHHVMVFRVSDRFDDYGLTGLASLRAAESEAHVEDFVLSCRVMGRGVEQTMLHALIEQARRLGLARVVATYRPTPRNSPCLAFFNERSGWSRADDGVRYSWDVAAAYPAPGHVTLDVARSDSGVRAAASR